MLIARVIAGVKLATHSKSKEWYVHDHEVGLPCTRDDMQQTESICFGGIFVTPWAAGQSAGIEDGLVHDTSRLGEVQ